MEQRLAARRRHLRHRRREEDGRPRLLLVVRRPDESLRGDVGEPGRCVLHLHRVQVERPESRRVRSERRNPDEPRAAVLECDRS